jgi:hypothetical protein
MRDDRDCGAISSGMEDFEGNPVQLLPVVPCADSRFCPVQGIQECLIRTFHQLQHVAQFLDLDSEGMQVLGAEPWPAA